ncbi:MAG: NAD-dependent epimerase/dehydratase family protein [Bacteroidetes bacterium]|nr:MAG: NAD-dependent epimerase/dehydratase family protein [Bacteroidota bacterium]
MKYFITGGAGFIGREVVKQLLEKKHNVYIYDDFSFGNHFNIEEFKSDLNFNILVGKIENLNELTIALEKAKPDKIIHLAALHFIPFCNSNPTGTINVNVNGTCVLFEAVLKLNLKLENILVASSGAIYPSTNEILVEGIILPQPVDIYGISKLLCENLNEYYSRKLQLPVVSMRFYNTYGPYETNPHILPDILEQLKISDVVSLGNVKSKRDYIFVEDISNAIIKLSEISYQNLHEIVNIGTGIEYSAEEIIDNISECLGRKLSIHIDSSRLRPVDKMYQRASIQHLKNLTGWSPKHTLKDGLIKLLKYEKLI